MEGPGPSLTGRGPRSWGANVRAMQRGTVTRWLEEKGYGLVRPDGWTDDPFVRRSSLEGCEALIPTERVN